MSKVRVLLGMSGGVDSTYAVYELRRMGYDVSGAVVLMHGYTEIAEAKNAAEALGVPLHIIDGRTLFEEKVVSSFVKEYRSYTFGRKTDLVTCDFCNCYRVLDKWRTITSCTGR